jgi:hypothetical protein
LNSFLQRIRKDIFKEINEQIDVILACRNLKILVKAIDYPCAISAAIEQWKKKRKNYDAAATNSGTTRTRHKSKIIRD